MEQEKKIIDILCDICGAQPEEIDGDLDLFEEGLLDSFGVIQLVLALEEAFGVTLEIGDIPREKLATPRKIASLIGEMKG
ncbi:MAG: D-alanine--poly(phosphoribitol) ligase subunit 2 [Candidatus Pararuminococcus gallinarum]|jgi:D-alanine--poly(phosphoribitol) ligase subunit 2